MTEDDPCKDGHWMTLAMSNNKCTTCGKTEEELFGTTGGKKI